MRQRVPELEQQTNRRGVTLAQMIAAFIQEEDHARLTTAMARLQRHGVLLLPVLAAPPAAPDGAPIPLQETPAVRGDHRGTALRGAYYGDSRALAREH